jgi:hypothetical protein
MLVFLDMAFFVFHTALMLFNMVGWAWRRSRPYHLICLLLTAASWFILGAFYGWGYCICTDWHFQVREKLGYPDVGPSYLQLLAVEFFGIRISQSFADGLASCVFAIIVIATAASWWRQLRHRITSGPASTGG